ncbi:ABC transporter substrate-binding protein, partial [Mesorhizobium sp. M4B.F.Ca.ET.017.02.2.1]
MSNRRHPPSPQAWAIAFALAAALSGCQSKGSVSEALDPAAIAAPGAPAGSSVAAAPKAMQATQSLGTGPAKITMLLPLSAAGGAGEDGRKML